MDRPLHQFANELDGAGWASAIGSSPSSRGPTHASSRRSGDRPTANRTPADTGVIQTCSTGSLVDLDPVWLYLLAFVLPFGETVALLDAIVPGEVGLVLLGAAAARAEISLVSIIAVASLGAFAGDSLSWYIGHRWAIRPPTRWEPIRRRVHGPLVSAERHFDRYGGRTVFIGRFVGARRVLVPLVAGTAGMPYRHFVPWNAAASVAWVSTVVVLGAVFGDVVADVVDRFGLVLTGLVVIAGTILVMRHRRRADPSRRSETE